MHPNLSNLCRGNPYEHNGANQPQPCIISPTHLGKHHQNPKAWNFNSKYELGKLRFCYEVIIFWKTLSTWTDLAWNEIRGLGSSATYCMYVW
jgi:hypothetical protein